MQPSCRLLTFAITFALCAQAMAGNMVHPTHAPKAMVATVHREASNAGVAIMQQGGNAVDVFVHLRRGFARRRRKDAAPNFIKIRPSKQNTLMATPPLVVTTAYGLPAA